MVTGSNGVDEIYDRMAEIRRERHTNMPRIDRRRRDGHGLGTRTPGRIPGSAA